MKMILLLAALAILLVAGLPVILAALKQIRFDIATNAYGDFGTHDDGKIDRACDAASATRYLLVKEGVTAGSTYAICGKTDIPFGTQLDSPETAGDKSSIAVLGAAKGTMLMVAAEAITAGSKLYTAAGGKVTPTLDAAQHLVGIALTGAAADGDVIEVAHAAPLLVTTTMLTILPVVVDADGATLTASQSGSIISNAGASGAATFVLPAATAGLHFRFLVEATQQLRIDPNGSETIALPSTGVQSAAGKYIWADALTEYVHVVCLTAGTWDIFGYSGTWTAEP